jgi:hypothetical protein
MVLGEGIEKIEKIENNWRIFRSKSGLTQHVLDAEDSAAFSNIFWLRVYTALKQSPRSPQRQ